MQNIYIISPIMRYLFFSSYIICNGPTFMLTTRPNTKETQVQPKCLSNGFISHCYYVALSPAYYGKRLAMWSQPVGEHISSIKSSSLQPTKEKNNWSLVVFHRFGRKDLGGFFCGSYILCTWEQVTSTGLTDIMPKTLQVANFSHCAVEKTKYFFCSDDTA